MSAKELKETEEVFRKLGYRKTYAHYDRQNKPFLFELFKEDDYPLLLVPSRYYACIETGKLLSQEETEEYLKQKLLKTVASQSQPLVKPKKDPNTLPNFKKINHQTYIVWTSAGYKQALKDYTGDRHVKYEHFPKKYPIVMHMSIGPQGEVRFNPQYLDDIEKIQQLHQEHLLKVKEHRQRSTSSED